MTESSLEPGIYFYRESQGTQQHVVKVTTGPHEMECRDLSGMLPVIRGPRYVSSMAGEWIRVDRAVDAARYLMLCLGGSGYRSEGAWGRKTIRNLFEYVKTKWPEFAP